jgi:hypothetical protein
LFNSLTLERFLDYASRYNQDFYPAQYLMLGLAGIAVILTFFPVHRFSRYISFILGFFYGWIGWQFYLVYFKEYMPIPVVFAILFLSQAFLFILEGTLRNRIIFSFKADLHGLAGSLLIFYAVFGYQALEYLFGRGYPQILSFGMFPCPTVIFTLGILLWTTKKIPFYVLIFPVLNALSGFIPAFKIGIIEDIGLIISGLFFMLMLDYKHKYLIFKGIKKEGP